MIIDLHGETGLQTPEELRAGVQPDSRRLSDNSCCCCRGVGFAREIGDDLLVFLRDEFGDHTTYVGRHVKKY